jgi:enoyl-CoA hydratase/carnithine racemase
MSERVTINQANGIADVRMNRGDKRNALDGAMFAALAEAGESLKSAPGLRAVVLSGEGPSFCAGLDFSSFQSMADGGGAGGGESTGESADAERPARRGDPSAIDSDRITHLGQQVAWVWQELPVPVIAAVHGHALGGGIQIALGADIRIVAPSAKLSVLEIRWGLVPDMTGTAALLRLVGEDVAKELTFTGRMVSGDEAVRLGLATRTADDPRAAATELAREIAANSPDAIRGAKRLLNRAADVDLAGQYLEESRELGALRGSPNQAEAVRAYFEKRPAAFSDPA